MKGTNLEHTMQNLERRATKSRGVQKGHDNASMRDLNHLRVFERIAALGSFSAAARALGMPKSSVSRSVSRLELELDTRLFQRNTRDVMLTVAGQALLDRCGAILDIVDETVDHFKGKARQPRGRLKVSAGVGFGINVLAELLPAFLNSYPDIELSLDLSTVLSDLIEDRVDVAVRLGPLEDSRLVAKRIGSMNRYLCAAPEYLKRLSLPEQPSDLLQHALVEMPGVDGRPRTWNFLREGVVTSVELRPRIEVNEALTIHRLLCNGAGVGCSSGYLCGPDILAGRLVHLLPEWSLASLDVNVVFPSSKALSPTVRAFVDFIALHSQPDQGWQRNSLIA